MQVHEDNKKNLKKLSITEMHRLNIQEYRASNKIPIVVICDNIRSMNNVGSIFRTADAFRIQEVILCGISPTPPHNDIHKTALGAEDAVPWRYEQKTEDVVKKLRNEGYKILCLEQCRGSIMLDEFTINTLEKYAVVLGNEVHGIDDEVISQADFCIEIPQLGTKHSLNVSVATGITLWHIAKDFVKNII